MGLAGWGGRVFPLSAGEFAVLSALFEADGRVVTRAELARRAGLTAASSRRCDGLLVGIRQTLGASAVRNVRGRGWMLAAPGPTERPV